QGGRLAWRQFGRLGRGWRRRNDRLGGDSLGAGRLSGGSLIGSSRRRRIVLLGGRYRRDGDDGLGGGFGHVLWRFEHDGAAWRRQHGLLERRGFDRRPLVGRQCGDRRLPLERIQPSGDWRDRPPAITDITIRGPG